MKQQTVILGIETANPPHCLTQQEALAMVIKDIKPSGRTLDLYKIFLSDQGIEKRYFSWDDPGILLKESIDERMKRFERWAVQLSVEAACRVMNKWQYKPADINAVFVSTCTGYLCPGLSTYVSQQLGLSESIYTLDLVGLGCTGALPAMRAADDYLNRYPDSTVLVIAVEICSAAVHWGQKPELILSNSIFSDGAAAVLLTNRGNAKGLRIKNISSLLWPQFRDQLRFKYLDSGLCNVISPRVPDIAAQAMNALHKKPADGNVYYAFHTAGRKVLDTIQERLQLSDQNMQPSRDILRGYGNMSSPSVLFVLKKILAQDLQEKHQVICFAFGAGFLASIMNTEWKSA